MDFIPYHLSTENKSFIETHLRLKRKGIRNNKFFLALRNPELGEAGFDPRSEGLTAEEKLAVSVECLSNPWYFFREVVRVPVPGGDSMFHLHAGNLAMLWLMMSNANHIVLLPRQNFKTFTTAAYFLYAYEMGTSNSSFIFSNKEMADAKKNLTKFKDMRKLLPKWMRDLRSSPKDIDNMESIESLHPDNRNAIQALASATDEAAADKKGRGMTVPIIWFDEFAFLKYNKTIYEASSPAQQQAAEDAAKRGKPHFKIVTTTPNNADAPDGEYCLRMIREAADFGEWLYDEPPARVASYVAKNSSNDFVYVKFTWREIGRSEEWYKQQCRALMWDRLKIRREIDLEWTLGTDRSVFAEDLLEAARAGTVRGDAVRIGDYAVTVGPGLDPGKAYAVGVDVAGGLDRDSSAIAVVDPDTLELKAWFKSPAIEIDELRTLVERFRDLFLPASALVVERSPISLDMIARMKDGPARRWMVYEEPGDDTVETGRPGTRVGTFAAKERRRYGVQVTKTSRAGMMDILRHDLLNAPEVFRAEELVEEIAGLQRGKGGRIDHAPGGHDDLLMAYLVARWALGGVGSCARILARPPDGMEGRSTRMLRTLAKAGAKPAPPPAVPFQAPRERPAWTRVTELNRRKPKSRNPHVGFGR